mmetsp:Transcript_14301/g.23671  ORF Transcript_14301/g.23671 Transcript_14301/m.23671 type:complete len:83 (+) Transcript_14301:434-682(+)
MKPVKKKAIIRPSATLSVINTFTYPKAQIISHEIKPLDNLHSVVSSSLVAHSTSAPFRASSETFSYSSQSNSSIEIFLLEEP